MPFILCCSIWWNTLCDAHGAVCLKQDSDPKIDAGWTLTGVLSRAALEMLKRKLCQDEEGLDRGEDEDILEGELSDDSTTSEEESESEQLTEETGGEDGRLSKTKVMILASRGVNARYASALLSFRANTCL